MNKKTPEYKVKTSYNKSLWCCHCYGNAGSIESAPGVLRWCLLPQCQRTVYRLTLVKEWNTDELEAYASLVSKGKPDFIEIKVHSFVVLIIRHTF